MKIGILGRSEMLGASGVDLLGVCRTVRSSWRGVQVNSPDSIAISVNLPSTSSELKSLNIGYERRQHVRSIGVCFYNVAGMFLRVARKYRA